MKRKNSGNDDKPKSMSWIVTDVDPHAHPHALDIILISQQYYTSTTLLRKNIVLLYAIFFFFLISS